MQHVIATVIPLLQERKPPVNPQALCAELRWIAELAALDDEAACAAVFKTPGFTQAMVMVMRWRGVVTLSQPTPSAAAVAGCRVAAAVALAHCASRPANGDAWLAHPGLFEAVVAATSDAVVGVRSAAAACLCTLSRHAKVKTVMARPEVRLALSKSISDCRTLTAELAGGAINEAVSVEAVRLLQRAVADLEQCIA
jgi:hypothetical protein